MVKKTLQTVQKISLKQALVVVLSLIVLLTSFGGIYLGFQNPESEQLALANEPSEPNCNNSATSASWNPFPLATDRPSPDFGSTGTCRDMPLLSFFPIDTANGNPREKNIIQDETFNLHLYYNNGNTPGGEGIANPVAKISLSQESETRYRISATLEGNNVATVTSAQKGGDLFINVPSGTQLNIVANNTFHYPDAMERKYESDTTGRRPNDRIPDNTTGSTVSNPVFVEFAGQELTSTNGFQIKDNLEAGFLGYGYILAPIAADVDAQPVNNPPSIPGQTITIARGQSGSFNPLSPTDPDGDYPISLDLSQIPSFCSIDDQTNSQGGGQTITCDTDANTPSNTNFDITPTDSRDLVGTPGNFTVIVVDADNPSLNLTKNCFVLANNQACENTSLSAGDKIQYQITAQNSGNIEIQNLRIVDTYDETKIGQVENISDNGVLDEQASQVNWTNLGNLATGNSKSVTFDATILENVSSGDEIVNTAIASADNLPEVQAENRFKIGGNLNIEKTCLVANSQNRCENSTLVSGDQVDYQIKVSNSTAIAATGVEITDNYNANYLTQITNISDNGVLTASEAKIVWQIGILNPGAEKTVTFRATIATNTPSGQVIKNLATVKSNEFPDQTDEANFTVQVSGDLVLVKSCFKLGTNIPCNTAGLLPGEKVQYKISVSNPTSQTAINVVLTDTYNSNELTNLTNFQPANSSFSQGRIVWNLGNLVAGAGTEVSYEAQIVNNLPTNTVVENIVIATSDNLPSKQAQAQFTIAAILTTNTTPRTGGNSFILYSTAGIMTLMLIGGSFWIYNKFRVQKGIWRE